MLNKMIKGFTGLLVCLVVVAGAVGVDAAPVGVVTFNPLHQTVGQGDVFTVELVGRGFTQDTVGGNATVGWDSALLALNSVDLSAWAGNLKKSTPAADSVFISVGDLGLSFPFPTVTGDFLIGVLTFEASAVNTGLSDLTLAVGNWADDNFLAFVEQPTATPGTVNVVPLPPAIFLLGGGLAGLAALRRRRG